MTERCSTSEEILRWVMMVFSAVFVCFASIGVAITAYERGIKYAWPLLIVTVLGFGCMITIYLH